MTSRPPLPDRKELVEYLLSFDLHRQIGREEEGRQYVLHHVDRFRRTLELLPRVDGTCRLLELGASPYFMTFLMRKHLGYEITPANYFGEFAEHGNEITVRSERFGESETFRYEVFNLEADFFPYADESFDVVLCCEILEHLIRNPAHLMREAHRVLRPGGRFVITTPNATRLENVAKLLRDENVYPPYSGYGVYGRHNREYSARELEDLYRAHNFEPDVRVDDAYPHGFWHRLLTSAGPLRGRRDNLFGIGRKVGESVVRYPGWLFEHHEGHATYVTMGDDECRQLGTGWHACERMPRLRWTTDEAVVYLRPSSELTRLVVRGRVGPKAVRGQVFVDGVPTGELALQPHDHGSLDFDLPAGVLASVRAGRTDPLEVRLRIEGTHVPARDVPGATDERELGLGVEVIALTYPLDASGSNGTD